MVGSGSFQVSAKAGNMWVHHRGDGLAQTSAWLVAGLHKMRTAMCSTAPASMGGSVHHSIGTQRQEAPKEMITSPCTETGHTPVEMFSCDINQRRISESTVMVGEPPPAAHGFAPWSLDVP